MSLRRIPVINAVPAIALYAKPPNPINGDWRTSVNRQHPSYPPGSPALAAGYYYLKPAALKAHIALDTGGNAEITTTETVTPWVHYFEKGDILTRLEGRDPDPMWILITAGPR